MKWKWEGYDEANFWLALSGCPHPKWEGESPYPTYSRYIVFFELFRYRVSVTFPRRKR